jgi:ATP synthase protein I
MAQRGGSDGADQPRSSDAELSGRLERLSRELEAERLERAAAERPARADGASYALAFRLASEFVAGVLVGAALGWGLDYLAGTSPWGLIGFLLLGFCAGVLNVVRSSGKMSPGAGGTASSSGKRG